MMLLGVIISVLILTLFFTSITGRGNSVPVQKILNNLASHFNGSAPIIRLVPYMKGHSKNQKFTRSYGSIRGLGNPTSAIVRLYLQNKSNVRIYIYTSSPGPVLNARRLETGDVSFDNEFIVYSNLPDEAKSFFFDENHLSTIRLLYKEGWSGLYISGRKIKAETKIMNLALSPQPIEEVLDKLLRLQITHAI